MTRSGILFLLALWLTSPIFQDESSLMGHLRFLASDELRGRANGSEESLEAAGYIAERFKKCGLLPLGPEGGYFQDFSIAAARYFGENNQLLIRAGEVEWKLERPLLYELISFGSESEIEGPLVFAGYGISAPEYNYEDYSGVDVRGKIVVLMEHEPREFAEVGIFEGRKPTIYSTELYKILNAKARGARGVLLIRDRDHRGSERVRPVLTEIQELGIPAARIRGEWGDRILALSGRDPRQIRTWIDHHATPYSFEMIPLEARITVDVVAEDRLLRNVIGFNPGRRPESIVIGAHYDHLGLGEEGSLAPQRIGEVHNGADDNASGTAGLLELATNLAGRQLERGILFVAFAGEELGLLGSKYFTDNPPLDLTDIVTMINMDMIGRSDGGVMVGGVGSALEFEPLLRRVEPDTPLRLRYFLTPNSPSDHLPFIWKQIPSLFFFTGLHADYHRPEDDLEKLDIRGILQIMRLVGAVVEGIASRNDPPRFVDSGAYQLELQSGERTSRVRLGVVPDMEWRASGVRIALVLETSPAAQAGLREGDILMRFAGRDLGSLHDLTTLLRDSNPGDNVSLVVLRGSSLIELTAVLEEKPSPLR